MKIILTAMTYLGLALIALSVMLGVQITHSVIFDTFLIQAEDFLVFDYLEAILCTIGVLLALPGALLMKARPLWRTLAVLGSCYLISLIGLYYLAYSYYSGIKPNAGHLALSVLPLLPGVACIWGGLSVRKIKTAGEPAFSLYTVMAYLGLVMMVVGTFITVRHYFYELTADRYPLKFDFSIQYSWVPVGWLIGYGSIITLVGSLIGRMRNLWIPMLIIGMISVLSFLPEYYLWYRPPVSPPPGLTEFGKLVVWEPSIWDIIGQMKFMLPGFGCIIGGFLLHRLKKERSRVISE
jgi:hypothetical protein